MSNPTEAVEEWLSTQVGALRKTLAKATLGAWTAAVPLILVWSGLSTANKIIGSILWVSVTLNLFLIAVVCWHRVERRRRSVSPTKLASCDDSVSELDFSLLELMYDYYPKRYTVDELEKMSGRPRVEVDHSVLSLYGMIPKLVHRPSGGLWHKDQPNPKGWGLTKDGMGYVKKRRSEQAVRGNAG